MKRYYLIPIISVIAMFSLYATRDYPKYTPPVEVSRGYEDWKTAVEKSKQIKQRQEQSEIKKSMDTQTWANIIAAITILVAIYTNPKLIKLERIIAELKNEIKYLKNPETLELALRKMAANRIESCRPELREFINIESERFIDVVTEITRGSFNYDGLFQAITKIEFYEDQSVKNSCKLGDNYCHAYHSYMVGITTHLKDQTSDIVLDPVYNSKQNRFSLACQVFLRDQLKGITDIYDQVAVKAG